MLIALVSVTLALVLYLFWYLRSELFRITERQSNTLMHMARMHRGLLNGIAALLQPPPDARDDGGDADDEPTEALVEEVEPDEPATASAADGGAPTLEAVPEEEDGAATP